MLGGEYQTTIDRKSQMRRAAYDARNAQPNKDEVSHVICEQFISLPEYQTACTVMWYINARSEVRTRPHLHTALASDKRVVIPYCVGDVLQLWWLQDMNELVEGTWKILEPPQQRWHEEQRQIRPTDLDLVMVPGVAFDRQGGRLGNGKGYYDKLLAAAGDNTAFVAVAYESQMFPEVPKGPYDVLMDKVVTEKAVYSGKRKR